MRLRHVLVLLLLGLLLVGCAEGSVEEEPVVSAPAAPVSATELSGVSVAIHQEPG